MLGTTRVERRSYQVAEAANDLHSVDACPASRHSCWEPPIGHTTFPAAGGGPSLSGLEPGAWRRTATVEYRVQAVRPAYLSRATYAASFLVRHGASHVQLVSDHHTCPSSQLIHHSHLQVLYQVHPIAQLDFHSSYVDVPCLHAIQDLLRESEHDVDGPRAEWRRTQQRQVRKERLR